MAADEPCQLYCRYFQDEEESPVAHLKLGGLLERRFSRRIKANQLI